MTEAYSAIEGISAGSHAAVRAANSFAGTPAAPTIAAPWKKPANITYIADRSARSYSDAMPASSPKYSAPPQISNNVR